MRPVHYLVLLIVILILFGASRLPDIARSIGKSARILKQELRALQEDDRTDVRQSASPAVQQAPVPPVVSPAVEQGSTPASPVTPAVQPDGSPTASTTPEDPGVDPGRR